MSGNRGEYRSISVVLLDGPDYRRLTERERTTLLVARLSLGPCAINAVPAFLHMLSERTGMPVDAQAAAWSGLQRAGWVYYDGTVAWVVRGLEFEPGRDITDWKHRKNVQTFIASLPRTALVGSFVARYRDWWTDQEGQAVAPPAFPEPDEALRQWIASHQAPSRPLRSPSEGPPYKGKGKGEGERKGEREAASSARARVDRFLERVAADCPEHVERFAASLRAARTPDAILAEFEALANGMHGPGGRPIPLAMIGKALGDIAFNGDQLTARRLRVFCGDLMRAPAATTGGTTDDEDTQLRRWEEANRAN